MLPIDFAIEELGKQEIPIGSNWGVNVQKYLKSVAITFPASWCMAFVYWCYEQSKVRVTLGQVTYNPLIRTGSVLEQWHEIDRQYKLPVKGCIPQPNDVAIFDHGRGFGHTGIVEYSFENGMKFQTIEGNTNATGAREGFEVERKLHDITEPMLIGFIRIPSVNGEPLNQSDNSPIQKSHL